MDRKGRLIWWGILGVLVLLAASRFLLPTKTAVRIEQGEANKEIVVYITGAVKHPGLLHLPLDARLDDALREAELSPDADLALLNPAQKLKDGQKIIVPYKAEELSTEVNAVGSGRVETSLQVIANKKTPGKININTAGPQELDTIPGIGPALAQRIIDYRTQNGLFSSPEDIQNVSGIGPKTYEKMAPYITVGH